MVEHPIQQVSKSQNRKVHKNTTIPKEIRLLLKSRYYQLESMFRTSN